MASVNRITREAAEGLAIQALEYLAGEPEQLGRFLSLSGLDPRTIRTAARDPRFLSGLLEYVVAEEVLLVAIARHAGVTPEQLVLARSVLSGPAWERDTA
jgi:hypothetical protein